MPPVHRKGDLCTGHGCYVPRPSAQGSPDVFVNAIPIHRVTDAWAYHPCPPGGGHSSTLCEGSPNVFANTLGVGRRGDPVCCGSKCMTHSPDVFANGG